MLIFVYISKDLMYNNMDNRIMGFCYEKTNNVYRISIGIETQTWRRARGHSGGRRGQDELRV